MDVQHGLRADDAVNETTPLVHDGVMFLWNFGDTIDALDAKTGTLLWKFNHDLPNDYPSLPGFYRTKRSLAIGGNKLIVANDRHARHCAGHQDRQEGVGCRDR